MDRETPRPRLVGLLNGDLQSNGGVPCEHQRRLKRQLLKQFTPHVPSSREPQLRESSARKQNHAKQRVIRQPRVTGQRQSTSERPASLLNQRKGRTKKRMITRLQTRRRKITDIRPSLVPIALALECVGRELHRTRTTTSEERLPVDLNTGGVSLGQEHRERLQLRAAGTQSRDEQRPLGQVPIQALPRHPREDTIRAELQKAGHTRLHKRTNPILSLIHISEPTRQAEISYAVF